MIRVKTLPVVREALGGIPATILEKSDGKVQIEFSKDDGLRWKTGRFKFELFEDWFEELKTSIPALEVKDETIKFPGTLTLAEAKVAYTRLADFSEIIAKENLDHVEIWGEPHRLSPSGFSDSLTDKDSGESARLLEELYKDKLMVKEKKTLVVDLAKSRGGYLVSVGPERKSIIDGASQIASLALGYNDPIKNCMALRPEIGKEDFNLSTWDISEAFSQLLRRHAGLPHVYFSNSGAEAIETAFRACQSRYPERRRVIAFEGSFHGRTLLALHCTHSPSKRVPFEIYPGEVEFMPYPETKDPEAQCPEPKGWLELWKTKKDKDFRSQCDAIRKASGGAVSSSATVPAADPLLEAEIQSLERLRAALVSDPRLAVIIEPMQCEGGDRYATKRFYRALRVLTRTFDTALVIDEVQTGFHLGNSFFWHRSFDMTEPPDAVCTAKKSQIGVCLSRFQQDHKIETSAASLYRGYLHAVAAMEFNPKLLAEQVRGYLQSLQDALGSELVQSPRGQGLAFAFDLPDKKILDALVAERFKSGILFYPAGDRTARFRLLYNTDHRELAHVFITLYKCFVSLAEKSLIGKIPTLTEWSDTLPENVRSMVKEKPTTDFQLPWKEDWIPRTEKQYLAIDSASWRRIFAILFRQCPQMLRSSVSLETDLATLNRFKPQDFWKHYTETREFTLMDLLWQSSRAFSFSVVRFDAETLAKYKKEIQTLQEAAYEPERRDDPEMYIEVTKDPQSIFLAAVTPKNTIAGICVTSPLWHFKNRALVDTDTEIHNPRALYSADISVMPEFQGMGLGLRLKCEQYMECLRQGTRHVRSRNRFPEARSMVHINRSMGSVIIARNDHDYDGSSTALYQSIELSPPHDGIHPEFRVNDPMLPALKNKSTLSNFVSPSYIHNVMILRDVLPEAYRHLFLASGRAEALDKVIKLLRSKRPQGTFALSFKGDYFGSTTACARSLGGMGGPSYYDWPLLEPSAQIAAIEKQLDQFNQEKVLGLFIEPTKELSRERRSSEWLESVITLCRKRSIPVVFHETASSFGGFEKDRLFATGDELKPDLFYFYPGGQLGVVATSEAFFLETPLQLISTWDGDEHSLNLLRNRILEWKP